jgi:hydrogenase expression/formation protein HypD
MRKEFILKLSQKIKELSQELDREIKIMHLCGTHEDTISKYNLRSILPENIRLISGPGCPVCIIPDVDLQKVFHLIERANVVLTTFGDMARVPFDGKSLFYYSSKGHDVKIVYSVFDAVEIAKESDKPVVHFGIGFETTMPSTAAAILDEVENFHVYSAHRYFLPAMDFLLSLGETRIEGFINPGHVSTIVGSDAYEPIFEKYGIPQVIAGFEPEDVMLAVYMLVKAIIEDRPGVYNEYTRAVKAEGNVKAKEAMNAVFGVEDWEWRGFGVVPASGAPIREKFQDHDALKVFESVFEDFIPKEDVRKRACRCGDVLRGLIMPDDCPLFMKGCTPKDPVGPCMVSFEGTCNVWAKYGGY